MLGSLLTRNRTCLHSFLVASKTSRRSIFQRRRTSSMQMSQDSTSLSFGPWPIAPSEVFASSSLCFAFVNLKPIVPGHVLVSTKRVVPRFTDLSAEEVSDLWTLAQKVGSVLEKFHGATSLTLTIQDGAEAGQTVPHVHVHVLPRKKGDFEPNDAIYDALDESSEEAVQVLEQRKKKHNLDEDRKPRTPEEMAAEANEYRPYFV